jgi:hypothetical protein
MSMLIVFVGMFLIIEVGPGLALLRRIERIENHADSEVEAPEGELLQAHQILIAESFNDSWGPMMAQQLTDRQVELLEEARAAYPSPTPEDVAWATEQLGAADVRVPRMSDEMLEVIVGGTTLTFMVVGASWLGVALVLSFILRGGLSFRLTGIRIRSRNGVLASRWHCLLRTVVAGIPTLLLGGAAYLVLEQDQLIAGGIVSSVAVVLVLVGIVYSMATKLSLQDRITGTRLVPR